LTDRKESEDDSPEERRVSHTKLLAANLFFAIVEDIPQMFMQTYNNFLIGKTLSWIEVVAPFLGYLSAIKTFHDAIYYIYENVLCKDTLSGPATIFGGFCTIACCMVPCVLIAWIPVNFTAEMDLYRINNPPWVYENFDIIRTDASDRATTLQLG
jgi:hypothetical protein